MRNDLRISVLRFRMTSSSAQAQAVVWTAVARRAPSAVPVDRELASRVCLLSREKCNDIRPNVRPEDDLAHRANAVAIHPVDQGQCDLWLGKASPLLRDLNLLTVLAFVRPVLRKGRVSPAGKETAARAHGDSLKSCVNWPKVSLRLRASRGRSV